MASLTNLPLLLDRFLTKRLGLPSAGEFSMQGGGAILLEGNNLVIECQSEATNWDDDPAPDDWFPEYFLSAAEVAELFPERLGTTSAEPEPSARPIDLSMSASYTGRDILFHLG